MLSSAAHSRRALAAAGLLAAAPVVAAKKKKGKKKKKSAPLVFAVVRVSDVALALDFTFTCNLDGGWTYPGVASQTISPEIEGAIGAGDQIRAQIAAAVQELVASELEFGGHDVPADRIAVTLL